MGTHTFRKGDRVAIEAVVDFVLEGNIKIVFDGLGSNAYVSPDALKLITPFFKPGDRVVHADGEKGQVVAIHDDMVWVNIDGVGLHTLYARYLTLTPSDEPPVAAVEPPSLPGAPELPSAGETVAPSSQSAEVEF